jgi:hypothetical protein
MSRYGNLTTGPGGRSWHIGAEAWSLPFLLSRTGKLPAPLPAAPKGALVAAAGKLPPPLQRFRAGMLGGEAAEPQLRIMFPPNNARLELANDGAGKPRSDRAQGNGRHWAFDPSSTVRFTK